MAVTPPQGSNRLWRGEVLSSMLASSERIVDVWMESLFRLVSGASFPERTNETPRTNTNTQHPQHPCSHLGSSSDRSCNILAQRSHFLPYIRTVRRVQYEVVVPVHKYIGNVTKPGPVFDIQSRSFPEPILATHQTLERPAGNGWKFVSLSHG